jgi:hypothetical protein
MVVEAVEKIMKEKEATLHVVKILEGKFEIFYKSQFGIKFKVTLEGKN